MTLTYATEVMHAINEVDTEHGEQANEILVEPKWIENISSVEYNAEEDTFLLVLK
jgi:hypothetical protein